MLPASRSGVQTTLARGKLSQRRRNASGGDTTRPAGRSQMATTLVNANECSHDPAPGAACSGDTLFREGLNNGRAVRANLILAEPEARRK